MTIRRFYAAPSVFDFARARVALDASEAHHLTSVLRLRIGDEARVFDGAGREFRCRVFNILQAKRRNETNANVELEILSETAAPCAESPLDLSLGAALLKNEKFDWVVQKATELGVRQIVPVITRRADVKLEGKDLDARTLRWQKLALEAAKQSGRAFVPQVCTARDFSELLEPDAEKLRLLFSEREGDSLRQVLSEINAATPSTSCSVLAVTGAEGGWEAAELERARDKGFRIVTLGGRILRAETAAITVAALLQNAFGDLN